MMKVMVKVKVVLMMVSDVLDGSSIALYTELSLSLLKFVREELGKEILCKEVYA